MGQLVSRRKACWKAVASAAERLQFQRPRRATARAFRALTPAALRGAALRPAPCEFRSHACAGRQDRRSRHKFRRTRAAMRARRTLPSTTSRSADTRASLLKFCPSYFRNTSLAGHRRPSLLYARRKPIGVAEAKYAKQIG